MMTLRDILLITAREQLEAARAMRKAVPQCRQTGHFMACHALTLERAAGWRRSVQTKHPLEVRGRVYVPSYA